MQNGSGRDIQRRTFAIVVATIVMVVAVLAYGISVIEQVRAVEGSWNTFTSVTVKRNAQLHRIERELGYGGLIHNFKNFVLRGDPKYMDRARKNIGVIYAAVDALRQEKLTEEEAPALDVVVATVRAYEVRLTMADDALSQGLPTNQVDSLVIVDDSSAIAALKALSDAQEMQLEQVQETTQAQLNRTLRFSALGLLAVPLILLVGHILYRVMRSMIHAHDEARAASRRLEELLDTSPEAMIVSDADGIIVRANVAAAKMLDYNPGELVGMLLAHLVGEQDRDRHRERYRKFFQNPTFGIHEITGNLHALTKTGRVIPVEINLGAVEQGGALLVTAAVRDISLRLAYESGLVKAREEAVAASNAKSDFLANMSHEIRTPINAVIGLSRLALKTNLDARQTDYANKIYASGKRLLEVVNDILDFSKIEAGKLDIDHSRFLLSTVIRDVSAMAVSQAAGKGLELIFRISPDVPDALVGDPLRLGQVLTNLVGNAVKFTDDGSIIVEADIVPGAGSDKVLKFSVTDTGIGIEADRISTLFEAFTQADSSATRRFGGTGLGLTICRDIVHAMGGEIDVVSKPGSGSTFTFTIPLETDPDAGLREKPLHRIDPKNIRVLVVDDSETTCRIMAEELGAVGFPVDTAMSGSDAIGLLEQASGEGRPYNILLLDWRMPGMDGLETARRIGGNTAIRTMPTIIIMTAFDRDDARKHARDLPIGAFLEKPLNTSLLIDTIVRVFSEGDGAGPDNTSGTLDVVALAEPARGKRVLVVEDNAINQQVAREILENEGLRVDTADNGRIACELLFKNGPDTYAAVLMDIQMPEMDGITATRKIRSDLSFDDMPIIALTAHALVEDRQRCLDAGMNDHLTKPIIADVLIAAMNTWIAGLPPQDESQVPPRKEADAAGTSVTSPDPAGDIMSLPVINLERASSISHLSQDFLEELLCDFRDRYAGSAAAIRSHLDKGETSEAKGIAHTVKGISGSLGAEQVYAAAVALDAGFKEDVPAAEIDRRHADFTKALDVLVAYIGDNIVRP